MKIWTNLTSSHKKKVVYKYTVQRLKNNIFDRVTKNKNNLESLNKSIEENIEKRKKKKKMTFGTMEP